MIRAYHFVGDRLRDGSPIPPDGAWLKVAPPLIMCERGLHASIHPFDALRYAPGNTLCLVDIGGEIIQGDDKLVATRRRIIARIDVESLLYETARSWALDVAHLWEIDKYPPVREYLETGNPRLRAAARAAAWDAAGDAAGDAARTAAWNAARTAAWNAAGDAAWNAAGAAQKQQFKDAVESEFISIGIAP